MDNVLKVLLKMSLLEGHSIELAYVNHIGWVLD